VLSLCVLTSGVAAAQPATPEAAKPDWRGTGVILKLLPPPSDLHATRPVIVLQHDPINARGQERQAMRIETKIDMMMSEREQAK